MIFKEQIKIKGNLPFAFMEYLSLGFVSWLMLGFVISFSFCKMIETIFNFVVWHFLFNLGHVGLGLLLGSWLWLG